MNDFKRIIIFLRDEGKKSKILSSSCLRRFPVTRFTLNNTLYKNKTILNKIFVRLAIYYIHYLKDLIYTL